MEFLLKKKSVIPGFGLGLGYVVFYLCLIVLIPLSAMALKAGSLGWGEFWGIVLEPRVVAAFKVSFGTALLATLVNAVFGLPVAWVLVRYRFPGRKIVDALVDLPFAMPTAVAGITLTTLFAPHGWVGRLLDPLGVKVAYTRLGITVALVFIGLPFVVRSVQPVLQDLNPDMEEAAASLGASWQQTFLWVLLPELWGAMLAGLSMGFARALGEYGSVVFISGNMPFRTEIAPLLIMTKLEQYDYKGATAVATVMLLVSFCLMLAINTLQVRLNKRGAR